MKAADVMTTAPITVHEETPILEVVNLLLNLKISGLPVLDTEGRMTGIVTEGDLLRRSELGTEIKRPHWKELFLSPGKLSRDYIQSHAQYAGEVMTSTPLTVYPDMPLDEVISLMEHHGIKRVPVVNAGNNLVGIITRVDIMKALRSILERNRTTVNMVESIADDESVKKEILDKISVQPWAPQSNIRVSVTNGVVDIYGIILDEDVRQALITLLEETIDRKHIRDHMVYIEPITGIYIAPEDKNEDKLNG
ncbi:hypothetical protein DN603_09485 [Raoultella planticola]|uniref:CBS domain-containing protein n=1 Tax=Raoultella planticola TaxID=575 RepID=A0A443VP84_RAOPL|nr:CBS domain-containing protein [Raoultella planticola]RWT23321.1 hypothetical protein DN603_09485 [Raoultella planticola]